MTRGEAKHRLPRPWAALKLEISNPKFERIRMPEAAQRENNLTPVKRVNRG